MTSYQKFLQENFKLKDELIANNHVEATRYCEEMLTILCTDLFDEEYGIVPESKMPETAQLAFDLMVSTSAMAVFNYLKMGFVINNGGWLAEAIKMELKQIDRFIEHARSLSLLDANKAYQNEDRDFVQEYAYLRIISGFYQNVRLDMIAWASDESTVYGRYFLFKDFLETTLSNVTKIRQPLTLKSVFRKESLYYECNFYCKYK